MRSIYLVGAAVLGILPCGDLRADEVSIERGQYISIIGGCHYCHTEGYRESEGKIDPSKALKGSSLGWQGPWGTTYAANLREVALGYSEETWVEFLKAKVTSPPMPWYQVQAMDESDMRSLYLYIKSLGDYGESAPNSRPRGKEPKTPYIVLDPPQLPQK